MALQSAIAGYGIALASQPLVQEALDAGLLVAPFGDGLRSGFGYYVITTPDAAERFDVTAFLDWIEEEARSAG